MRSTFVIYLETIFRVARKSKIDSPHLIEIKWGDKTNKEYTGVKRGIAMIH